MLRHLQAYFEGLGASQEHNFLTPGRAWGLSVVKGDNNLDTCYQYVVNDKDNDGILKIKYYDKVVDLVAREATHLVGSRTAEIVGSKRALSTFNERLARAKDHGLTRIEISFMLPALRKYPIWAPSVKTVWHRRVVVVLKHLVTEVINDSNILPQIYRRMSLSKLMLCLARTEHNLLVIGTSNSWLVTARTAHPPTLYRHQTRRWAQQKRPE